MNTGNLRRIRSVIILLLDVIAAIAVFSALFFQRLERFPDYQSPPYLFQALTLKSVALPYRRYLFGPFLFVWWVAPPAFCGFTCLAQASLMIILAVAYCRLAH